jgi:hypothetical protein
MDINEQDAFKLGFLARCAEEKLTGTALEARLEKVAEFNKSALIGLDLKPSTVTPTDIGGALWNGLSAVWALPHAASIIGGAGLGYGAAKMVEPAVHDDEIRAQELINTYKLYADKAKNRKKVRQYRLGQSES